MHYGPHELLTSSLSMWWLRPENGLAIASYVHNGFDFLPKPGQAAADYACGDGVNTFFKLGGRFQKEFDLFGAAVRAANTQEIVEQKIDVFDYFDDIYEPKVLTRPTARFEYGTDHKANLLRKATKLGFYVHLVEADLMNNTEIPDESLDIVYCNSLYWVPQPDVAVGHIYRKLRAGGLAVFDVMTTHRKAIQFQHLLPSLPNAWQSLMNRGREANNPGILPAREWRKVFEVNGVAKVEEERDILPAAIAHAWNIGLRPLFPVLNRMVQSLTPENRQSIKEEWVEIWVDLLLPLLLEPEEFPNDGKRVRLQYVVRKR